MRKYGLDFQRNANNDGRMTTQRRKIIARKYSDPNRPNLKFVVAYREAGKRKRQFFDNKKQAESFADFKNAERHSKGIEHAEFSTALRVMTQNAVEQLQPFGRTIDDAIAHYVAHLKASEKSCTAEELVKELVATKERDGLSVRHVSDLRCRLKIFAKKFDGLVIATITSAAIDDWLRSLPIAPVTRNHYRRLVVLAFNYAIGRGYATSNPAESARAKNKTGNSHGRAVSGVARQCVIGNCALPRHWTVCRTASRGD